MHAQFTDPVDAVAKLIADLADNLKTHKSHATIEHRHLKNLLSFLVVNHNGQNSDHQ